MAVVAWLSFENQNQNQETWRQLYEHEQQRNSTAGWLLAAGRAVGVLIMDITTLIFID